MAKELKLTIGDEPVEVETLEVDLSTEQVKACLNAYFFDDHQFTIYYFPSLDLTSYGNNEEQAKEMMETAILPDLCEIWLKLNRSAISKEFEGLGWTWHKREPPSFAKVLSEDTKKSSAFQVELSYT